MNRQQQIDRFLLAAHRLAVARLRAEPQRIGQVRALLRRWRGESASSRSDPYWDEWERLLSAGIDALEAAVCADTDHAASLRNVSPLSVLMSQRERADLLQEARAA